MPRDRARSNHLGFVTLTGCAGFAALLVLDAVFWGRSIFEEGPPDFSPLALVRSALIAGFAVAFATAVMSRNRDPSSRQVVRFEPGHFFACLCTLLLASAIPVVFLVDPGTFNLISFEDGPVEWASALLLFASGAIFVVCLVRHADRFRSEKSVLLVFAAFAFCFFLTGLEEVSWFQRIIGYGTPEQFQGTDSNEVNFHNFHTDIFENTYYFGSFLFLIALPFIAMFSEIPARSTVGKLFVPKPFVAVPASVACGYNYDMWNVVFIQVSFIGAATALVVFALKAHGGAERFVFLGTLVVCVATQVVFLLNGEEFARPWQATEYRELLIPLAFFGYAISVFNDTEGGKSETGGAGNYPHKDI